MFMYSALEMVLGVRSLVISRSTFVGSGRYTGHWLGDNASQWKHMINSIPGLLESCDNRMITCLLVLKFYLLLLMIIILCRHPAFFTIWYTTGKPVYMYTPYMT